jgi:hypothetical protein
MKAIHSEQTSAWSNAIDDDAATNRGRSSRINLPFSNLLFAMMPLPLDGIETIFNDADSATSSSSVDDCDADISI